MHLEGPYHRAGLVSCASSVQQYAMSNNHSLKVVCHETLVTMMNSSREDRRDNAGKHDSRETRDNSSLPVKQQQVQRSLEEGTASITTLQTHHVAAR